MTEKVTLPDDALKNGLYATGKTQDLGYIKNYHSIVGYTTDYKPIMKNYVAGRWEHCRESFQYRFNEDNFKEMMFKTNYIGRTQTFLEITQDMIGLKGEERLTVHKTQHKGVVLIKLSEWWRVPIRFNLLTILLRASRDYTITKADYWGTLEGNKYLGNQEAFKRFLKGYTRFTGKIGKGWRSALGGKKGKKLHELLVKPKK